MNHRVVFDTITVLSALLFPRGSLAWLRLQWRQAACSPLISRHTAAELTRVLAYPKFNLSPQDRLELLADYLPFCTIVDVNSSCPAVCRDTMDQPFLDLAHAGKAHILVSGDHDLLALAPETSFIIESPHAYHHRVTGS